jgi:site-specific DNA-methyltransferase (adenine-specific)
MDEVREPTVEGPSTYYEAEGITIYHGDCREILPALAANCADVIVTDPPYGMEFQSARRPKGERLDRIEGDDGSLDVPVALTQALRLLRRGRHVYIFGRFDLSELPLCSQAELIWDKEIVGSGNLELPWAPAHENITFAVYEISKANREKGYGNLAARMRRGSVIRCQRMQSGQVKNHPTEKPVPLLRQLIESSSVWGETVLDPFMGSGSTLVAAKLEGRKAIGIEVKEKYCETAVRRLQALTPEQEVLAI